jgi:hypothetical protein
LTIDDDGMPKVSRRTALVLSSAVAAIVVAGSVLAASPSPSAGTPPGLAKSPKPDKGPEIATTVRGTVAKAVDADGKTTFTITAGGTTWSLSAGPDWFWGDKNPLNASVGKTVSVAGSHREGSTDIDVETVDGTAIREPGRPPWAGGPWAVGSGHPGWKDWMADGKPGNGHGREDAPGQVKKAAAAP